MEFGENLEYWILTKYVKYFIEHKENTIRSLS